MDGLLSVDQTACALRGVPGGSNHDFEDHRGQFRARDPQASTFLMAIKGFLSLIRQLQTYSSFIILFSVDSAAFNGDASSTSASWHGYPRHYAAQRVCSDLYHVGLGYRRDFAAFSLKANLESETVVG